MATAPLKHIDETRLEEDLAYRFDYLCDFMGFGEADIRVIHACAPILAPLVPAIVDAVYEKLFTYDATKRHFVIRQHGYEGEVPATLEELSLDHEQIKFRKHHLGGYLKRLVTAPYDAKMVDFLDMVGRIHTPKAGNPDLNIPLVQMNALMGFVAAAFVDVIMKADVDHDTRTAAALAFTKLLWIQNDLIVRHYAG
ncbi:MAG: protoglobin family protein [Sumerlaeia bacterium]